MSVELTRPYPRNQEGDADVDGYLQILKTITSHKSTGAYSIRASMPNRTDRTKSFTTTGIESRGKLNAWFNGNAEDMSLFLENSSAKPCTITSVQYIANYNPRNN